ncbi:hypothetical protein FB107DRAFT_267401 [Schizophyllum commune]
MLSLVNWSAYCPIVFILPSAVPSLPPSCSPLPNLCLLVLLDAIVPSSHIPWPSFPPSLAPDLTPAPRGHQRAAYGLDLLQAADANRHAQDHLKRAEDRAQNTRNDAQGSAAQRSHPPHPAKGKSRPVELARHVYRCAFALHQGIRAPFVCDSSAARHGRAPRHGAAPPYLTASAGAKQKLPECLGHNGPSEGSARRYARLCATGRIRRAQLPGGTAGKLISVQS